MPDIKNVAPEGTSVVSPYLILKSVEDQIGFLTKVFNAEVVDSVKESEGHIMHSEVRIGGSTIMMGRANEKFPPNQSMIYVYVDDVDSAYRKALESGAKSAAKPEDKFYGNREGGVVDTQGNTWWIAQYMRKVSKE
jgi:PhnB protein